LLNLLFIIKRPKGLIHKTVLQIIKLVYIPVDRKQQEEALYFSFNKNMEYFVDRGLLNRMRR